MGWLTNPKKAAYNRVYNRTTFDIFKVMGRRRSGSGGPSGFVGLLFAIGFVWLIRAWFEFRLHVKLGWRSQGG